MDLSVDEDNGTNVGEDVEGEEENMAKVEKTRRDICMSIARWFRIERRRMGALQRQR